MLQLTTGKCSISEGWKVCLPTQNAHVMWVFCCCCNIAILYFIVTAVFLTRNKILSYITKNWQILKPPLQTLRKDSKTPIHKRVELFHDKHTTEYSSITAPLIGSTGISGPWGKCKSRKNEVTSKEKFNTYHNWSIQCLNHTLQSTDVDNGESVHTMCTCVLELLDILKLYSKYSINTVNASSKNLTSSKVCH
jgi:hypothetical protein